MKRRKQIELFGPKPEQPFLRVEVSIPAARAALSTFAHDRMQGLETLTLHVRESVSNAVTDLLNAEMTYFLGQPEQADNKRNGTREREYWLKGIGALRIQFPRDRKGQFESVVIPSHERIDPRTKQDLAMLYLGGLSNRTLSMISERLLGIEVSKSTVAESLDTMTDGAVKWLTRPLEKKYWALYIDGTNFKVQRKGTTCREPSLCVLGVDDTNRKSVLAIEPGARDNVDAWRAVFQELKRRGLDASAVKLGIMDGLPGLEKLFREEFPNAVTQRCWLHVMRNALAKSPARYQDAFQQMATRIMYAPSEQGARESLAALEKAMGVDAQRAVAWGVSETLCNLISPAPLSVRSVLDESSWTENQT